MIEPELRVNRCGECHNITTKPLHHVQITETANLEVNEMYRGYLRSFMVGVCDPCFVTYNYKVKKNDGGL
jgi:hypothetical protein